MRFPMLPNQDGITFLELLVVITILIILAAAATPIYTNFQPSSQLNEAATQTVQSLRTGVEFAKARYNNAGHGVYFDITPGNDSLVLYQGATYATRNSAYDRTIQFDPPISIVTTLVGNEVHFTNGNGYPDTTGTITITHETAGVRTITINAYGVADAN